MNLRLTIAATSLLVSTSVFAAPTTLTSTEVNIDFDPDNFFAEVEVLSFDSKVWTTLPFGGASVSGTANGVNIGFSGNMQVSASVGTTLGTESYAGNYSIPLLFTAHSGFKINSYTITYSGTYGLSNAGSVFAGGTGTSFSDSVYAAAGVSNSPFSVTATIAGAALPTINGSIQAIADYGTIQVYDGTISQFDHFEYQEVCDPSGTCIMEEVAIYIDVPVYHDEGILGTANINLDSIQITAQVAAVPEPESYAMLLAGLGVLSAYRRRTNKRVA